VDVIVLAGESCGEGVEGSVGVFVGVLAGGASGTLGAQDTSISNRIRIAKK
jgi:hypothetical protein